MPRGPTSPARAPAGDALATRHATEHSGASVTRVVIEIGRDVDGRLSGTIRTEHLDPACFDGVIELLARIEELVDRDGPDGAGAERRR
jgi:hypothetical protein